MLQTDFTSFISQRTTFAPSRAISMASCRPMPWALPVMSTTSPLRSFFVLGTRASTQPRTITHSTRAPNTRNCRAQSKASTTVSMIESLLFHSEIRMMESLLFRSEIRSRQTMRTRLVTEMNAQWISFLLGAVIGHAETD